MPVDKVFAVHLFYRDCFIVQKSAKSVSSVLGSSVIVSLLQSAQFFLSNLLILKTTSMCYHNF